MNNKLFDLTKGFIQSGDMVKDAFEFLRFHNRENTLIHSKNVAEESVLLARRFGYDERLALIAGAFHDISAVFSDDMRLQAATELGIDILPEEREFPLLLHQKLSRIIANEVFKITEEVILNAIECHTTLKGNPSIYDIIVFVADKLQWDQAHTPPYINEVRSALDISLEHAAYAYIKYLLEGRSNIKVIHPWLLEAYNYLKGKEKNGLIRTVLIKNPINQI